MVTVSDVSDFVFGPGRRVLLQDLAELGADVVAELRKWHAIAVARRHFAFWQDDHAVAQVETAFRLLKTHELQDFEHLLEMVVLFVGDDVDRPGDPVFVELFTR